MFKQAVVSLLLVGLSACGTVTDSVMNSNPVGSAMGGDKFNINFLRANIIVGKTTQADVRRTFGEPQSTDSYLDNPDGRWDYSNKTSSDVFGFLLNHVPSLGEGDDLARNSVAGHDPKYGVMIGFHNGVVKSFAPISPNGKG
jgi:outer membrane protein assembly factor BamE (lipoprotein component of BamABCDE complex)